MKRLIPIFSLVAMLLISGSVYGYIWFDAHRQVHDASLAEQTDSCLNLKVVQEAEVKFDIEKVYLSLLQNKQLQAGKNLEVQNPQLGVSITLAEKQIDLKSSKPFLQMSREEQQSMSGIVASVVGSSLGNNDQVNQELTNHIKVGKNLQLQDNQKTLKLDFSCQG